jgi:hypothetical protein
VCRHCRSVTFIDQCLGVSDGAKNHSMNSGSEGDRLAYIGKMALMWELLLSPPKTPTRHVFRSPPLPHHFLTSGRHIKHHCHQNVSVQQPTVSVSAVKTIEPTTTTRMCSKINPIFGEVEGADGRPSGAESIKKRSSIYRDGKISPEGGGSVKETRSERGKRESELNRNRPSRLKSY